MKTIIYHLAREVFKVMLVGSLIFLIMELIKPRSVLAYLNFNFWLVIWLLSGIILLTFSTKGGGSR